MNQTTPRDYSFIAPYYDQLFHRPLSEGHEEIGKLLRKTYRENTSSKVLEVGVGSGLTLNYLPSNLSYTGVDINEEMIFMAHEKVKRFRKKAVSLAIMDASKLKFSPATFDLVIASSVLTAMDDPMKGFSEMIRVTKKGGRIAVIANIRNTDSLRSHFVRSFDPITRRFLGFRLDLTMDDFVNYKNVRPIECRKVNTFLGFPLSTYLLFEKK